ncbi:hypothetical protein ACFLZW_05675 [Chloroflexota bacterium]
MPASQTSLNERCRRLLGDSGATTWTDLKINEWINDAIVDLSHHFPRVIITDLSTTLNTREYDLELNFIAALSVEFPQGEDPPVYLERKHHLDDDFWITDGYYDILDTQTADSTNDPQIFISEKPAASLTIRVRHTAVHNELSAPADITTLEDRHLHLIAMFVRWKCWENISIYDGTDPDPLKDTTTAKEEMAAMAGKAYLEALQRAKDSESTSAQIHWTQDKYGQIY